MIFTGADADTANEIAKIIGKNKEREGIIEYYSAFLKKYHNTIKEVEDEKYSAPKPKKSKKEKFDPINIVAANRLFISDKSKLLDLFVKEMHEKFNGHFQQLDFTNTDLSVSTINNYVCEETKGKIDKFFTNEDLDKRTTLIVLNVVYFMANWATKFQPRHEGTFYSEIPRKTDMMTGNFYDLNYTNSKDWHAIGIPYRGGKTCMYIVLPKEKNGLEKVMQSMDHKMFMKFTKENFLADAKIDVTIPVFEISDRYDLCNILSQMGIRQMFHKSEANFSRMFKDPHRHFVNKAIHMATIKVDENGTEATAATSFGMMPRSAAPPKKFVANHLFIYFIVKLETKEKNIEAFETKTDNKLKEDAEENIDELVPKEILFAGIYC
uniref:Serpin domain-containing protein n=1 Tax=Panagrolaimus superbus TaxID=310955 RepID=A0A914YY04_9BILA